MSDHRDRSSRRPAVNRRITALLDTGFSGFLLLPMLDAFPLGLMLHGTIDVTLADGSSHSKLTCLGTIVFEGQSKTGVVIVEEKSAEALIGMEFLKKFRLGFLADPYSGTVALLPSTLLRRNLRSFFIEPSRKPRKH